MTRIIIFCISGYLAGIAGVRYGSAVHNASYGDPFFLPFQRADGRTDGRALARGRTEAGTFQQSLFAGDSFKGTTFVGGMSGEERTVESGHTSTG